MRLSSSLSLSITSSSHFMIIYFSFLIILMSAPTGTALEFAIEFMKKFMTDKPEEIITTHKIFLGANSLYILSAERINDYLTKASDNQKLVRDMINPEELEGKTEDEINKCILSKGLSLLEMEAFVPRLTELLEDKDLIELKKSVEVLEPYIEKVKSTEFLMSNEEIAEVVNEISEKINKCKTLFSYLISVTNFILVLRECIENEMKRNSNRSEDPKESEQSNSQSISCSNSQIPTESLLQIQENAIRQELKRYLTTILNSTTDLPNEAKEQIINRMIDENTKYRERMLKKQIDMKKLMNGVELTINKYIECVKGLRYYRLFENQQDNSSLISQIDVLREYKKANRPETQILNFIITSIGKTGTLRCILLQIINMDMEHQHFHLTFIYSDNSIFDFSLKHEDGNIKLNKIEVKTEDSNELPLL